MEYLFIGIGLVFVAFCLWALVKANSFTPAPKKEKVKAKPSDFSDENYVLVKEEKPKKVKIEKEPKVKNTKDNSQVVPVFTDESGESVKEVDQNELIEKEKEDLYNKYVLGQKEESVESPVDDEDEIDKEIERRIAEIRRKNGMADSNEARIEKPVEFPPQFNEGASDRNYYGYGVGARSSSGSMKDPNFDPWADEATNMHPIKDIDLSQFDDDFDEDVIANIMGNRSTVRNERLFRGNRLDNGLRTSRLGAGSVSGQVSSRPLFGSNMIVGQSVNTRPDIFDDGDI
ncbi:MAG: hypothetical protein K6F08_03135 [bacterium]|nr:hypothetical protein [bacterium]